MHESSITETTIKETPITNAPDTPATQTIKLIVDSLTTQPEARHADDTNQSTAERYIQTLDVPTGRSLLFLPPVGSPRITTVQEDGNDDIGGSKPYALEPFRQDHQYLLLLVSPPGEVVLVNGSAAPSPAILTEGDQIRAPHGDHVLHVTFFLRPYVGAPTAEMVAMETECSLCRLALGEGTRVYICPFCNSATHLETDEHKVGPKPLQCAASTTTCPNCSKAIVEGEGLTYVPQEVLKGLNEAEAVHHG